VKAIALALPIALALGLAACDRPSRTADKSDPARESVALRPSNEATAPRAEASAPNPPLPAQSAEAKAQSPAVDAELSEKVRQALVNEHGVHARDLQVVAQNGVVTLSGKVDEKSDQERMMLVAMSVDGVRSVVSNLVVDRPA
jgi:hyperosmotically inducible periplasmic protein